MSTNLTNESNRETSPKGKGRIRRVLKRAFYLIIVLIGTLAIYAWVTGARQEPIETGEPQMKAVVYTDYGSPDVLQIRDIKKPVPNDDQILIKVRAASVNPLDWHFMEGTPYIMRAMGVGLRKPKNPRLGVDMAGEVEAVGKNVTELKPGDEVFGGRDGAFAEYVCARADRAVVLKPANITFAQAASVPVAAITALQGLRDKGKIKRGQKVLINGATGGVGSFAVQIAKSYGPEVTAVTSTRNLDLVRSLGADHVVDYTTTDFVGSGRRYDLVLDTVGNRSVPDLKRALAEGGKAAVTGFTSVAKLLGVSLRGGKDIAQVQAHVTAKDLELLSELIAAGKVRPQIDRRYPFAEIPAAIAYLEQGHARGKVVVEMA